MIWELACAAVDVWDLLERRLTLSNIAKIALAYAVYRVISALVSEKRHHEGE